MLICDAPAHGYYESIYAKQDNYPDGTPDVPSLKDLVAEFKRKEIALQVLKLNKDMDKMVQEMQAWWPDIDMIDVLQQKFAAREESGSDYGDSDDDEKENEAENQLREYFMSQVTDAT